VLPQPRQPGVVKLWELVEATMKFEEVLAIQVNADNVEHDLWPRAKPICQLDGSDINQINGNSRAGVKFNIKFET
jgi:hypothetical protein